MLISVVVALYNEEESIALLLSQMQSLRNLEKNRNDSLEFIFVNDGSKDNTLRELSNQLRELQFYKLISHERNQGFGAALRTGINNSNGDIIVCYDADCTYPVEHILLLSNKVKEGFDVASANPFHIEGKMDKVPLWRKFFTWTNALLYKIALGKGSGQVALFSCAFRAYKASIIKPLTFKSNGFGAASEILGRLIINKALIVEIPSVLSTRQFGVSKMNIRKAVHEHFKNLGMFIKIRFFKF